MNTYFLGKEEVHAFVHDLVSRLLLLGDDFPVKWLYIGESGRRMVKEIYDQLPPKIAKKIFLCMASMIGKLGNLS